MSISLPTVNLSGVAIGQSGKVSFQNAGVDANPAYTQKPPSVFMQNESGTGLNILFTLSQSSFTLAAGKHVITQVIPGESGFTWTALYNLPNPPVTSLFTDYYYPNEPPPDAGILGNSPIGIGGTISVTNVTALSNETNPINTLVIDLGIPGNTNLLNIFNDHFVWKVLQGGVVHTVLTGEVSGNPLLLGQAGDTVECVGSFLVDQNMTIMGTQSTGTLTLNNGGVVAGGDWNFGTHGITAAGLIVATTIQTNTIQDSLGSNWAAVTASTVTRIATGAGGTIALQVPGGTTIVGITAATSSFSNNVSASGHTIDADSFQLDNAGSFKGPVGSWSRLSNGTMTSTAGLQTITHGLGATPTVVIVWGNSHTSTTTMGSDTYTSTQFDFLGFATGVPCAFQALRV
jgi:hypothetical protein